MKHKYLLVSFVIFFFAVLLYAQDTFPPASSATPDTVGEIRILFFDHPVATDEGRFEVEVTMTDGSVRVVEGSLIPHLTAGQISSIQTFLDAMRTKAEAEILP